MRRRKFISATTAAGLASAAPADPPKNQFFHLVYFYMRSGSQVDRTQQYLNTVFLPAAKRNGIGTAGFFSPVIGERSPFILSLVTYPSLAAMETIRHGFLDDKEFVKGWDDYNNISSPGYVRMESALLRAEKTDAARSTAQAQLARAAVKVHTFSAAEKVATAARRATFMVADGDEATMILGGIRRFTKYDATGLLPAKRLLAQAALAGEKMPL